MTHERLALLIQAQRSALLAADPETRPTHETILRLLTALDHGEITAGHAERVLVELARGVANTPSQATLYRQVAADLRQMQRKE